MKPLKQRLEYNLQFFARQKNALTSYFVAPMPRNGGEPEWMELARWISSVTDDSDENTEDMGYYDGDGTPETDVMSVKEAYNFEGTYDHSDPAMKFIAGLKRKPGQDRKIMMKKVEAHGDTAIGRATVANIVASGGEATEYGAFSCLISFDRTPEVTEEGSEDETETQMLLIED
ncbi:phage tail tube protein [Shouchella lehensis]|uniref:Phage tail protein n=1 Tax=Shouchella lehensis TaxID=300825 RepID=A0A4Y7WIH2_9BACI|nr:phage tail protein [Shouchella lehensis]MBG9785628.1 major tail shaft protein [Shouchella lehensis]TES48082.1 phage tail protein [Shouchella lehensis]